MSQVAALLLMYFDDEDAFWALHVLMCGEKFGMHGKIALASLWPELLLIIFFSRVLCPGISQTPSFPTTS